MDPIILDDFLPQSYVNEIFHTLTMVEFDWHLRPYISYGGDWIIDDFVKNDSNIVETRAFSHRFFFENEKLSSYCDFIRPILYFVEEKTNLEVKKIERMRAVLAPRNTQYQGKYNVPHVDLGYHHFTLIYYVDDSDGGTVIFKQKHDPDEKIANSDKKDILTEIECKKGRAVIFDGLHYHTGRIPAHQDKILININFC